jgi:nicotinamidase-related amidase
MIARWAKREGTFMTEAFGLSIPDQLSEVCAPTRCAVIIYDMQKGIVPQISSGREVVARCRQILDAARAGGYRIFFTRHCFLPNAMAGIGQLRRAMVWQRKKNPEDTEPAFLQGTALWEIVPELAPGQGEVVIDKITMSAFEGSFLHLAMRDARLDSFIIAGIALEVGIGPTVRHALDLNICPVLVSDACGSKTEELRKETIATLEGTGEVYVASSSEILSLMRSH